MPQWGTQNLKEELKAQGVAKEEEAEKSTPKERTFDNNKDVEETKLGEKDKNLQNISTTLNQKLGSNSK